MAELNNDGGGQFRVTAGSIRVDASIVSVSAEPTLVLTAGSLTIHGNVGGGAVWATGGTSLCVIGDVEGGNERFVLGIYAESPLPITVHGNLKDGAKATAVWGNLFWQPAGRCYQIKASDGPVQLALADAANLRAGTRVGSVVGTLAVPPAESVAAGVPVDHGIGSAVLTPAVIREALAAQGYSEERAARLDAVSAPAEVATAVLQAIAAELAKPGGVKDLLRTAAINAASAAASAAVAAATARRIARQPASCSGTGARTVELTVDDGTSALPAALIRRSASRLRELSSCSRPANACSWAPAGRGASAMPMACGRSPTASPPAPTRPA